ncbi:LOW QUALITY PROTEIN: hypothetical protein GQ55_5G075000 [Panicum hallii var. hallii]|uniref:Major facilitator superfamily (MFS) profile domain-containing protein n=1 Tax=Panicum hallii var. hallii TaxID=1504633 RepID=A0A2T7DDX1_9POAL|nr:LOW QUALITY PROTEIN: hypothetical protein GQ55_5G075000 [Panicum hallii var. hallii]
MESGQLLRRPAPSAGSEPSVRGGWRAAFYLVVVAFLERLGFYGVQGNLIMYLTGPLGMPTAAAAAGVNAWAGTVQVLPLVGALAADTRLGRYRAVLAAGVLYLLSLGMLTASSALQAALPHSASSPPSTSPAHLTFIYVALYLLALAQGFHRPCAEALGADQFALRDGGDPGSPAASRSSYFNWFHFSISWGYATSTTVLSYVEDNAGWTAGFGACWAMMVLSLAVFVLRNSSTPADSSRPREHGPRGSSAARLLDRQPEEVKGVIVKLLPIGVVYTLFTKQGSTLDRRLVTGLVVPPAALQCLISFTFITMLPVYDRAFVPWRGASPGTTPASPRSSGSALAWPCPAPPWPSRRSSKAGGSRGHGRGPGGPAGRGRADETVVGGASYVLMGLAMALADVGLEEFFYDQVPDAVRSVGLALCLSAMGAGSYASGMLVSAVDWATRGSGESWISDNLNRAHLDYFYWLVAGLAALDVAIFLYFSKRFVYRNKGEL